MTWIKRHRRSLIGGAVLIVCLSFLWSPQVLKNKDEGYVSLSWSGFSALFKDKDFGMRSGYFEETAFNGVDGPYVFVYRKQYYSYQVREDNTLHQQKINPADSINVFVPNADRDSFDVVLRRQPEIVKCRFAMPDTILAISDIEGNFNAFQSFLIANKVIDKEYNWTFRKGHLVLLGDFTDRGHEVTQIHWLIYRLEALAAAAGGKVHYILGNHELLNLQGKAGYADRKYVKAAQEISGKTEWDKAFKHLYAQESVLGAWLRKKNSIVQIGNYLFVHGGLSPQMLDFTPSLETINNHIRQSIDSVEVFNPFSQLLLSKSGPLWYRGMAEDYKSEKKLDILEFQRIMKHYNAGKIVIGHTIAPDIMSDYNGDLIRIDVVHGIAKHSGQTKGLLITKDDEFQVDDLGKKQQLPTINTKVSRLSGMIK